MDPRIRRFRRQVEVLNRGREPRGRRYGDELRRLALAIAAYLLGDPIRVEWGALSSWGLGIAADRRRRGETLESVARARGLTSTVLCRWQRGAGGQRPGLRPVIAPEAREPEAPVPALVLVTRGGGRLEGLGVAEAIQVLRALS